MTTWLDSLTQQVTLIKVLKAIYYATQYAAHHPQQVFALGIVFSTIWLLTPFCVFGWRLTSWVTVFVLLPLGRIAYRLLVRPTYRLLVRLIGRFLLRPTYRLLFRPVSLSLGDSGFRKRTHPHTETVMRTSVPAQKGRLTPSVKREGQGAGTPSSTTQVATTHVNRAKVRIGKDDGRNNQLTIVC